MKTHPFVRRIWLPVLMSLALLCFAGVGMAQEAVIRKNISERLPTFPKIDEVSKTPFAGLYELRVGKGLYYADADGNYVMQGELFDTRARTNLTQARLERLNEIDFNALPLRDAMVWRQGTGARKLAVFSDPNCPYCKRLETELRQAKDVTVYTFLMPILGPDSADRSRNIWCAKDSTRAWHDWMLQGKPAAVAPANCDHRALDRNVALGRKLHIGGTPGIVFESGRFVAGALNVFDLEKILSKSKS